MVSLVRNIQFFDLEAQRKVTGSYVVVIGLGGVGSHAASMLLRSGVGKLLLVDFDQVLWGEGFPLKFAYYVLILSIVNNILFLFFLIT